MKKKVNPIERIGEESEQAAFMKEVMAIKHDINKLEGRFRRLSKKLELGNYSNFKVKGLADLKAALDTYESAQDQHIKAVAELLR
tara:strand:+ start:2531 stop:2785 length:255 start_codon:yes stop_codon:yes gene_type:complete